MSNQILLIAGIGVALFLMSSQGTDRGSSTPVQIIKEKRPVLPVEMPIFHKQAVPIWEKNHLGTGRLSSAEPYILPSPLARDIELRKMGFLSVY